MSWADETDYRPWLRRVLDGWLAAGRRLFGVGADKLADAGHQAVATPGNWLSDWWERFRLADGWAVFRNLVLGLPALAFFGACLFVTWFSTGDRTVALVQRYHRAALKASETGDSRTAVLLFSRMQELDRESTLPTRELAEHYDRLGKPHLATLVMRLLTPPASEGDPDAYFWLATHYLRRPLDPFCRRMAQKCLESALAARPEFPEADAALGRLLYEEGANSKALALLRSAAVRKPYCGLDLARAQAAGGNVADAKLTALQLEKLFRTTLGADPTDRQARARLAEAHLLLARFPTAVNVLREGLNLKEDSELRSLLARVFVVWGQTSNEGSDDRWRLWEEAFRTDPANAELLRAVLVQWGLSQAETTRLAAMLEKVRGDPASECEANLLLALLAKLSGNKLAAEAHLELAATRVSNPDERLARMVYCAPLRPDVSLQWIELGAVRWSASPTLRRERALLLYKAGKHRDCLKVVESLLAERAEDPILHAMLAECLDALGEKGRADEHRLLAHPYFSEPKPKGSSS